MTYEKYVNGEITEHGVVCVLWLLFNQRSEDENGWTNEKLGAAAHVTPDDAALVVSQLKKLSNIDLVKGLYTKRIRRAFFKDEGEFPSRHNGGIRKLAPTVLKMMQEEKKENKRTRFSEEVVADILSMILRNLYDWTYAGIAKKVKSGKFTADEIKDIIDHIAKLPYLKIVRTEAGRIMAFKPIVRLEGTYSDFDQKIHAGQRTTEFYRGTERIGYITLDFKSREKEAVAARQIFRQKAADEGMPYLHEYSNVFEDGIFPFIVKHLQEM